MEIGAHAAATIAPEGRDRTMKPKWAIRSAPVTASESFARSVFETNDGGDLVLKSDAVPAGMLDDVRQAVDGCPTRR